MFHGNKFAKANKPRRMTKVSIVGRADAHYEDTKVMFEERKSREYSHCSSTMPEFHRLQRDHEARLFRRYK